MDYLTIQILKTCPQQSKFKIYAKWHVTKTIDAGPLLIIAKIISQRERVIVEEQLVYLAPMTT
jgi:hypothetical protein